MKLACVIVVSVLVALPPASRAAQEKVKATDDPLATSKRELEALKEQRISPNQAPRVALPSDIGEASLPDSRVQSELAEARRKQKELMRRKAKSENWLVDGVQKNTTRNSAGRDDGESDIALPGATAAENKVVEIDPITGKPIDVTVQTLQPVQGEKEKPDRGDRAREAKAAKDVAVENPLNRYMGEWMTSRDYSLLKPAGDAGPTAARVEAPGTLDLNIRSLGPEGDGFFQNVPGAQRPAGPTLPSVSGMPAVTHDNPYLQSLTLPAPSSTPLVFFESALPMPASAPPLAAPSFGTPVSVPESKSGTSLQENLKRSEDAKYFPQLKRF